MIEEGRCLKSRGPCHSHAHSDNDSPALCMITCGFTIEQTQPPPCITMCKPGCECKNGYIPQITYGTGTEGSPTACLLPGQCNLPASIAPGIGIRGIGNHRHSPSRAKNHITAEGRVGHCPFTALPEHSLSRVWAEVWVTGVK